MTRILSNAPPAMPLNAPSCFVVKACQQCGKPTGFNFRDWLKSLDEYPSYCISCFRSLTAGEPATFQLYRRRKAETWEGLLYFSIAAG